jgi:hypothetical protein
MTSNIILSVLESSFFQHDVLMQQENALANLENGTLDTAYKLRELKQESSKSMLSAIRPTATIKEEELTRGHCPTLTSLGVDLSTGVHIKSLFHVIFRLHKDVSSIECLSFEAAKNDRLTTLIQIPRLDNRGIMALSPEHFRIGST